MSKAVWFYADASRQQQGPVDSDGLAELFRAGRIDARTLLWREGLPSWQALASLGDELPWLREALTQATAPPPIPLAPSAPPAPPAKKGTNAGAGCAIAVAVGFVAIMVLGLLLSLWQPKRPEA